MFNVKRLACFLATGRVPEMTVLDQAIAKESLLYGISDENIDDMLEFLRDADETHKETGTEGSVEDEEPKSLKEHDEQYHPEGFKEGDSCKFRDNLQEGDRSDVGLGNAVSSNQQSGSNLSNRKRREYEALMKKKHPELDADMLLQELGKINDKKVQGDAFRWVMKGAQLPRDIAAITLARQMAEKAKVDPMEYDTPQGCIDALSGKVKQKDDRIDPDTVPELSDKQVLPMGVTTYLVQDDKKGQQAMRKIMDTHWGKDASPWCLLRRDDFRERWDELDESSKKNILMVFGYHEQEIAELAEYGDIPYDSVDPDAVSEYFSTKKADDMRVAWDHWNHYNALPKRVAFKDGKLLAFMATDGNGDGYHLSDAWMEDAPSHIVDGWEKYANKRGIDINDTESAWEFFRGDYYDEYTQYVKDHTSRAEEQWWNRQNNDTLGIPLGNIPVQGDKFGRWANFEIRDGRVKQVGGYQKGRRGQKGFVEWRADGSIDNASDGTITYRWRPDGSFATAEKGDGSRLNFNPDGSFAGYFKNYSKQEDPDIETQKDVFSRAKEISSMHTK